MNQGAKGSHKGKTSKTGLTNLENPKTDIDNSWTHDGWNCDEWNDDWSSVGWHGTLPQAPFHLDVSATSRPKRFAWVKMNLDTGAAGNAFPLNFGPEGAGHGRFYLAASGEWIPDGGTWQFQGHDENGLLRSLNGRLIGEHKVLCSAAEIARVGRQDFYLGHDGGYMIPIYSKNGQGMRNHFEKLVSWYGNN